MILLQNDLITIQLHPEPVVLEVIYGDLYLLPIEVIKEQIDKTMAIIASKGIAKVLYDSSSTISAATKEESREIATYLISSLNQTPVERVARLQSPKFIVDTTVRENLKQQVDNSNSHYKFETFTNRDEAFDWLSGWESRQMT